MNSYIVTTHAIFSVFFWCIAGFGATFAVFSTQIKDTTFERVALSFIAINTFATAARVIKNGWISEGGMLLSFSLALYVVAIICKKWKPERVMPTDKEMDSEIN